MSSTVHDGRGAAQGRRRGSNSGDAPNEAPGSGEHRLEASKAHSSPHLESLPAELRTLILLNVPDLLTLRTLVHASPAMHAQYRHDRDRIIPACLSRELDGFFIDAYATVMSRARELRTRTDESIAEFLGNYETWLSSSTPNVNSITPRHMRWLVSFHTNVARPLARLYSDWALANLDKAVLLPTDRKTTAVTEVSKAAGKGEPVAQDDYNRNLSRSEEIRIFRALYRFETYQHLFGRNKGRRQGALRPEEINELFFGIFDPWEAEAVGCIETFIRAKYDELFNQAKADLHEDSDRYKYRSPIGSCDLDEEYNDYMDGTISRGLKLAARLLSIDDHEVLVDTMERRLTHFHNNDASMSCAIGRLGQFGRRDESPNPANARDVAERRGDAIHFTGDAMPPNGQPFAWVALWNGRYSNIYGEYVPESVRRWGYVMWDERRFVDMGADENLFVRQWSPELLTAIENDYDWRPVGG